MTSSVEPLWTVRRGGRSVRAQLCPNEGAWDVRLFSDGHVFAAHTHTSRELALVWADAIYDSFVAEGWVAGAKAVHASWPGGRRTR